MSDEVAGDVARFREVIARELGLQFDDSKLELLAELARRRGYATGRGAGYVAWLAAAAPRAELAALAEELTVGETYFFRNLEQFKALTGVVVPDRVRGAMGRRILHVLSAGCASGEEAYSLAIAVREALPDSSWDVVVRAYDVNPAALQRAATARYSSWSLRETPPELQRRWFRQDGRELVLADEVRSAVRFDEHNLAADDAVAWPSGLYDVIFCRNVLMYFTPAAARAVVAKLEGALARGGYLFLGHAETLRGLSQRFHLCHTHGTFYYQLRDGVPAPVHVPSPPPEAPVLAHEVDTSTSWVDAIRGAAERIRALSAEAPTSSAEPRPGRDLGHAVELLQQERFAEALRSLPDDGGRDVDTLLLRAVLQTHGGQLADAEDTCRRLLGIDELNAGAHYVLALCREGVGDRKGAVDHDQAAVYLDPTFAMPRLHLGLLARRAGDRETARRELGHALLLLQREDASRLLLFGGGFQREALLALSRAELAMAGER